MMQRYCMERPTEARKNEPLPAEVSRDIHLLVRKAALCCRTEGPERDLVVVIRRRPVDRLGREGCRVEILADGPMPAGGLRAIRSAGGADLWADNDPVKARQTAPEHAPASRTLALSRMLMGGWKLIYDVKWAS
jgi:hypothetical protein